MLLPNLGTQAGGNGDLPRAMQRSVPCTEGFLREVVWLTGPDGQTTETPTCGSRTFHPKLAAPFKTVKTGLLRAKPRPPQGHLSRGLSHPSLGHPPPWVLGCLLSWESLPPLSAGLLVPGGLPAGTWDRSGGGSEPPGPPC